jgi:hypothetical protein
MKARTHKTEAVVHQISAGGHCETGQRKPAPKRVFVSAQLRGYDMSFRHLPVWYTLSYSRV